MEEKSGTNVEFGSSRLTAGQTSGGEYDLGSMYQPGSTLGGVKGADQRRLYFGDVEMKCYDWTCYMREIYVDLNELDEHRFTALFHWVVETPVHAATDHPEWKDDVTVVFTLYTNSGAFITSFVHYFRRGCGTLRARRARRLLLSSGSSSDKSWRANKCQNARRHFQIAGHCLLSESTSKSKNLIDEVGHEILSSVQSCRNRNDGHRSANLCRLPETK